jgi:raffinose/stachyose/melibiose transport system substrate-binding protein
MRRILFGTVTLFFLAAAAIFAAGKDAPSSKSIIKLNLYNYVDVSTPEYATFQQVLAKFEEMNPAIKISVQNLFNDPYHQKLQAMAVAGQIPDLVYLWPTARTGYVTGRGLIKDLRPFLGRAKADFIPADVAPMGPEGQIWELPTTAPTDTTVVYTNDALLRKLGLKYPKTLDDLIAQSPAINAAGLVPIAMANKDGWEMESCLLSTLVGRLGGDSWLPKAISEKGAPFDSPLFIKALDIVKRMSDAHLFPAGINEMDYDQGLQLFEQQKAVYLIDGSWRVQNLEKDLSPEMKADISLNTLPSIPGQMAGDTVADIASTGYGMNARLTGAKAEAAWKWIWFYAGPEGSAIDLAHGLIPGYSKLDLSKAQIGPLTRKLVTYLTTVPGTNTVLDGAMDAKVIGVLNPDLQVMMFDQKTPAQVAQDIKSWYASNPS